MSDNTENLQDRATDDEAELKTDEVTLAALDTRLKTLEAAPAGSTGTAPTATTDPAVLDRLTKLETAVFSQRTDTPPAV